MSPSAPERIIIFGVTGHLGLEVAARVEGAPWSGAEVVGVVSGHSEALEFECRGELLDAVTTPPTLRAGDIIFVCTPPDVALEVVRNALQAQAPCIDCTGLMAEQAEVSMPVLRSETEDAVQDVRAPLIALPGATTLAWAPIIEELVSVAGVKRVVATVLHSASALGRRGLVALSEESIAIFNQSETPEQGPAGQNVAFDVIPLAAGESKTATELGRIFGESVRSDVTDVWVPTFVGEGASLAIELTKPLEGSAFVKVLSEIDGVEVVEEGVGTRGLASVDAGMREPSGPTLRDAAGGEVILVGDIRPDSSLALGLGWRVWLSYDPVRIAAAHAVRLAAIRFSGP